MTPLQETHTLTQPSLRSIDPKESPGVTVVVPTHNRPETLRRALTSIFRQTYAGSMEVIVVFDRADPDESLLEEYRGHTLTVTRNTHTPGLAGARNSGIFAARNPLLAFCDDDDTWQPHKLATQIAALLDNPTAEFATTAMMVDYQGRATPRLANTDTVEYEDLLRSRMAMLHSSSFLIWWEAMVNGIGMVDETLPRSMAEDSDLLLRAARRHPLVHVDQPLVTVTWGAGSYFADQWAQRNETLLLLLDRYPEKLEDPVGAGLSYGKLAFREAAQGHRASAFRWASKAFRSNWREPRTYLALGVALKLVPTDFLLRQLNKRGHGI